MYVCGETPKENVYFRGRACDLCSQAYREIVPAAPAGLHSVVGAAPTAVQHQHQCSTSTRAAPPPVQYSTSAAPAPVQYQHQQQCSTSSNAAPAAVQENVPHLHQCSTRAARTQLAVSAPKFLLTPQYIVLLPRCNNGAVCVLRNGIEIILVNSDKNIYDKEKQCELLLVSLLFSKSHKYRIRNH